ncbi:TPA: transposase [Legionella pneumophila]|uniref:Uncharacterized protein n=1 Tax=Legionella pneumophila TaxID=446 RepID=A0A2S6EYY0_LEGPN|nr:hypothetical protein [Legionella pneumophila]PPK30382.1 hypothetical protein C3928_06320 [Legionella pneumophila]RYB36366.1 hypothetical protein D7242_08910 [Legionella pneumophila]RYW31209.1 hypothetical protein D7234_02295 [Legionella pneumophila]TIH03875.1 hypothetical protein DI135_02515 [Legionella pneumophila]
MSRMVIDDVLWDGFQKLSPKPKGRHGNDARLFMEAICSMLRTGATWRDLSRYMAIGKAFIIDIIIGLKKAILLPYWQN